MVSCTKTNGISRTLSIQKDAIYLILLANASSFFDQGRSIEVLNTHRHILAWSLELHLTDKRNDVFHSLLEPETLLKKMEDHPSCHHIQSIDHLPTSEELLLQTGPVSWLG